MEDKSKPNISDTDGNLQRAHGGILEEMVRRLSDELARYQIAAGGSKPPPEDSTSSTTTTTLLTSCSTLPPWLQEASALSPLLIAYDKQISQKDAMLNQQRLDIIKMKEEFNFVLNENTVLHEELERSKACLQDALQSREEAAQTSETTTTPTTNAVDDIKTSSDGMTSDSSILLKENDLLIQQQREYQAAIDRQELQIEELSSKTITLQSSEEVLKQQNEHLRQREVDMSKYVEELENTNTKLQSSILDNTRVIEKHKIIMEMKESDSISKSKVEAAIASYQLEVDRLIDENSKLSTLVATKANRNISLQHQVDSLNTALDQERENMKSKGHESEYFRMKAMEYEQKIHDMQTQESEMILKVDEALEAASMSKIESDRASLSLDEKCKEIQKLHTLIATHKRDVLSVTEEKASAFEQKYRNVCEEKREVTKRLESVICELKLEKDQLLHKLSLRDRNIERLRKEAIVTSIDDQTASKDVGVNIYEEQLRTIKDLRRERDEANETASSIGMTSERESLKWDRERSTLLKKVDEAEEKMNDAKTEFRKVNEELEKAKKERNDLQRQIRTISNEHRHEMNATKTNAESALLEQHERMRNLQFGYEKNIASKIDAISEAQTMLRKSEELSFKFKEEVERMKKKVETVQKESELKVSDLHHQLKKNSEHVDSLKESKTEVESTLQSTKHSLASMKAMLESFRKREHQMKKYIQDIVRERDSLLEAKASLQSEIEDLDLQRQRLSRQRNHALEQIQVLRNLQQAQHDKDGLESLDISRVLRVT